MAFSSMYQPYIQGAEMPVSGRQRDDGALKRYQSVEDSRAWSNDKLEKSMFLHDIIKRSSNNQPPSAQLSEAVKSLTTLTKEELVNKIKFLSTENKTKDVELDKIHKLFKQTSKKLEQMNDIVKDKRDYEMKLKESEAELKRLQDDRVEKEEKLKTLEKEVSELKCSPSAKIDTEQAWNDIKNRAEMYDGVVKERNVLKNQLCKMVGVEDLLRKLKKRADEADKMEQEVTKLNREMQRYGHGAAGDEVPKRRIDSACKQCHNYANDLHRSETMLDDEIKKNTKTQAEANFLRARVRSMDVMEAEFILYKTKYEEAAGKLMVLKEALVRAESSEKQLRDMKQQLKETEGQLQESERHAGELINVVERQEVDLKESELYIEHIMNRLQQGYAPVSTKQAISYENLQPGKVQSIVRQLSVVPKATNCKCGFDDCECLNVAIRSASGTSKQQQGSLHSGQSSSDSVHQPLEDIQQNLEASPRVSKNPSASEVVEPIEVSFNQSEVAVGEDLATVNTESNHPKVSSLSELQHDEVDIESSEEMKVIEVASSPSTGALHDEDPELTTEASQLAKGPAMDEILLLRQQNAELDRQLTTYKEELQQMTNLMNQVEQQRQENIGIEQEVQELQTELAVEAMQSSIRSSINEKDDELNELKSLLNDALAKKDQLEKELATSLEELNELRPLRNVQEKCVDLEEKLMTAKSNNAEHLKELKELNNDCEKLRQQNLDLLKHIKELEVEISEQETHSKNLTDQLTSRSIQTEQPRISESLENRELLIKAIKDLKRQHDELRKEKLGIIKCYEKKLKSMQAENNSLEIEVKQAKCIKPCLCESNSKECGDVLVRKIAKFGLESLMRDELEELHNRVRYAMMKIKRPASVNIDKIPCNYYTRIADQLRAKYNLNDSLPFSMDPDDVPVKDFDACSAKTMPSILRNISRKSSTKKTRARSSEVSEPADSKKPGKSPVSIARYVSKK